MSKINHIITSFDKFVFQLYHHSDGKLTGRVKWIVTTQYVFVRRIYSQEIPDLDL